ncbi:MAG: type III-B CRISPR module RAMP protein Cmr6 [Desulfamplus sp.]
MKPAGNKKGHEKKDVPKLQPDLYPLPCYLTKYADDVKQNNFGLFFKKFWKYELKGLEFKAKIPVAHKPLNVNKFLSKLHERQTLCLASYAELGSETLEISAISETPLLTGIGETSPTEVGMVFDRNMGIPYLPASSIKGAVRYAYCVNFANAKENYDKVKNGSVEEKDVKGLVELFGGTDADDAKRGGFAFIDAYSETVPELKVDIMNPHHGKYYQNQSPEGPIETELPIPIKFLVVEKGLTYKFRGFFINKDAEKYKDQLIEAFRTAMTLLGLGAKTAVGYGRFNNIKDTTESIKQKAEERKKEEERKNQAKLEQDERERKAKEAQEAEDKKKADAEKLKQEAEALKKEDAAQKAAEAEALEKALANAEGIDKDILLMKKEPTEDNAIKFYDKYIQKLNALNEKEIELALLIKEQFGSYGKKTKDNKLKRKNHLFSLLKKI